MIGRCRAAESPGLVVVPDLDVVVTVVNLFNVIVLEEEKEDQIIVVPLHSLQP